MTPTQNLIFDTIFQKRAPDGSRRIHIETYTQFGKSDTVSMAVLTRVATFGEKWVIVAPTQPKARIIMGDVIKHAFENEYTMDRMKLEEGESMEQLRRERSKNKLTFNVGNNQIGELFIVSAESRLKNQEDIGNSMMGFGAPNLVMDEAALVDDGAEAKAMRMIGGFTQVGLDFVVKIGNPFRRNHFLKSYEDPLYFKIKADYLTGIKEGRLSETFVEEMKKKPFFRVLYECRFPEADDVDDKGWSQLISEDDIERAMLKHDEHPPQHIGEKRLGNDIARGGNNETVWALRSMNYMNIHASCNLDNLSEIAARTAMYMKELEIDPSNTFIDEVGVGGGVVDPLLKQNIQVRAVNVGMPAIEHTKYANLRAEAYWRFKTWLKQGGRLNRDERWYQMCKIKYRPDSKGRIQIMSKDTMRSMGIDSPDVADAGMLTFVRPTHIAIEERRAARAKKKKHSFNRGVKVSMGGY